MASPRERAASIATARFSLIFFWPMNSARRCGRSFSSKQESSSTGAAETSRLRVSRLGLFFTPATGAIVPVLPKPWPLPFFLAAEPGKATCPLRGNVFYVISGSAVRPVPIFFIQNAVDSMSSILYSKPLSRVLDQGAEANGRQRKALSPRVRRIDGRLQRARTAVDADSAWTRAHRPRLRHRFFADHPIDLCPTGFPAILPRAR